MKDLLIRLTKSLRRFFTWEIWRLDFEQISRLRAFFYRHLLISYLVARAFVHDRLLVRASALVYATLLSLVPLLAVMFALLKGFGFHNRLEGVLQRVLEPLGAEASQTVVRNVLRFVDNVDVGALSAVGLALLLFSVLSIINNIERAFNDIWKIRRVRSLHRRFSDYLSVLVFGPFMAFLIVGITASLQSVAVIQTISTIPGVRVLATRTAPLVVSWLAFLFLIVFVPNTRVRFSAAAIGAVVSGTLWQVANQLFAHFIVTSYQTGARAVLYASFATLPLFLIWLYISWAMVLLGAEIAYAYQNVNKITWEVRGDLYSPDYHEALALRILLNAAERFRRGAAPLSSGEMAESYSVPERLVNESLARLTELGYLYTVGRQHDRYVLGIDPDALTIDEILTGLRGAGLGIPLVEGSEDPIAGAVQEIQQQHQRLVSEAFSGTTLSDVLTRSV